MPRAGLPALLTLPLSAFRTRLPLDNHLQLSPAHQPLGALSTLPPELLHQVLSNLSIPTLTAFRRVNRLARATVNTLPAYASLINSHEDIVRAVIAANATFYTCNDLQAEIQSSACRKCGAEATHLYLITCRLVCHRCFTSGWRRDVPPSRLIPTARAKYGAEYPYPCLVDPDWHPGGGMLRAFEDYVPLQEEHVLWHCKQLEITREELREVPHALSLPGGYWDGKKMVSTGPRVRLYDTKTLLGRYEMGKCRCMRNWMDVMRRYQAVVALEETEKEREGDKPIGAAKDPFEPSYRDYHWN
ncbi:hypothetical protein B0T18DRAFT_397714 [Schizothecium vesticola]|uniref:F-box domain-containing protein n=1 Tax=Schizothecium vesticola TaxID=314040 RepID=A0AA40FAJ9_9PEZI|nr:hypothetical protein B0T18DRAFT_397714 [Schizothecium vesticola]